MMDRESIRDYIFIDEMRVRSYFRQAKIGRKYLAVEKAASWSAGVSLRGPNVGGTESVAFREPNLEEMIVEVEDHLLRKKMVRPLENIRDLQLARVYFGQARMKAVRAIIPLSGDRNNGLRHFSIWISTEDLLESEAQRVYLIEAVPFDGEEAWRLSGCTALNFILQQQEDDNLALRQLLLGSEVIPDGRDRKRGPFYEFSRSPVEFLKAVGARITTPRTISTLFKVRLIFADDAFDDVTGIIGYPMYVYA